MIFSVFCCFANINDRQLQVTSPNAQIECVDRLEAACQDGYFDTICVYLSIQAQEDTKENCIMILA